MIPFQQTRIGTRKVNFNAVGESRCLPRASYPRLCSPLWGANLLGFVLFWHYGPLVERLRDLEAVAFFVVWLAPDQQPELHSSEQQWLTA